LSSPTRRRIPSQSPSSVAGTTGVAAKAGVSMVVYGLMCVIDRKMWVEI